MQGVDHWPPEHWLDPNLEPENELELAEYRQLVTALCSLVIYALQEEVFEETAEAITVRSINHLANLVIELIRYFHRNNNMVAGQALAQAAAWLLADYDPGVAATIAQSGSSGEQPKELDVRPEDVLSETEYALLERARRQELSCPNCAQALQGRFYFFAEAGGQYKGVRLHCAQCGFEEW